MGQNIIDDKNVSYQLDSMIGEGSQGYIYLLRNEDYIAKLFKDGIDESFARARVNFLIQLGLDKNVFAVPQRFVTAPSIGYIARCAKGMVPLRVLKEPDQDDIITWFNNTGGLAKRFQILIKLADALRTLHGRGLMYMDLSPNNVFISESPQKAGLMLIDLDNVCFSSRACENIYTPFYGAPEVVNSLEANTSMSDCYSFAVIAYELLTTSHPLIGDYVSESEPEIEDQALRGMIPWVDNKKETINKRSTGIPTHFFAGSKLLELFARTFEDGLNDSTKRPTISEWYNALKSNLDELVKCDNCGIYFPGTKLSSCPLCDMIPPKLLYINIRQWNWEDVYDPKSNTISRQGILNDEVISSLIVNTSSRKKICAHHLMVTGQDIDRDQVIAIVEVDSYSGNGNANIRISTYGCECKLVSSTNPSQPMKVSSKDVFEIKPNEEKYFFCFGNIAASQRVITFNYHA